MRKSRSIEPAIKFYKHRIEERYLRTEGSKTSQYIYEFRNGVITQKIIQSAQISSLERDILYKEIPMWQFESALYNGHAHLYRFENGQDPSVQQIKIA